MFFCSLEFLLVFYGLSEDVSVFVFFFRRFFDLIYNLRFCFG